MLFENRMLLETRGLCKRYRGRQVVKDADLYVRKGEIVGLLGPNGAGKTTTFYMIVGLVRADSGRVMFNDRDVTRAPMYKRARMGIGYLSQEPSVFRKMTVEENVVAVLETLGMGRKEMAARAGELLEELGLAGLAGQRAYTLSGGERRKLEITRALACNPLMMMLDEPFSGVDPLAVQEIQQIVVGLKGKGMGIVVTDHNVRETLAVVDRAYLMYEGKVLREGASSFLINDEVSRELYLGKGFSM